MNKNITLNTEESLIQKAREKAMGEKKSLNVLFRDWLRKYVHHSEPGKDFEGLMKRLSYARVGSTKITREAMNERR